MNETPLAREIRALIASEGPISLARYMQLCLGHPRHGYYHTRDPLGAGGDFVTAPEVSQMFGELIGLWCGETWMRLGSPGIVHLVELGPGRGTLMADAWRALRSVPGFHAAARVHLVETSPVLRARQRDSLRAMAADPLWHDDLASLPKDAPLLVIANEFFDALPVRQWQRADGRWHERVVGLAADGSLALGLAPLPDPALNKPAPDAVILAVGEVAGAIMRDLAGRLAVQGGVALAIDYGHLGGGTGDTLQAVKAHRFVDPLAEPGEADLTTHVDFEALAGHAAAAGARIFVPIEQGAFLEALGLRARAARLATSAGPTGAAAIDAAVRRLTGRGPDDMGSLFKVLAIAGPQPQALAVFGPPGSTPAGVSCP